MEQGEERSPYHSKGGVVIIAAAVFHIRHLPSCWGGRGQLWWGRG